MPAMKTGARRPQKQAPARSRYFIEAIGRGLSVMSLFDSEHPTLSLAEIARGSQIVPSTALRFIQTLVDLDFLEELAESGRYRPSLGALKVGFAALSTFPLRAVARPILERVHKASGESVNLFTLSGASIILVETLADPDVLSIHLAPGSRYPAHCTAAGKAMLAYLPPPEMRRRLASAPLQKLGPNTISGVRQLEATLASARAAGYAVADEELATGMRAIAAPVLGPEDTVEGAISIVVSAARVSLERLRREFGPLTVGAAAELSARVKSRE